MCFLSPGRKKINCTGSRRGVTDHILPRGRIYIAVGENISWVTICHIWWGGTPNDKGWYPSSDESAFHISRNGRLYPKGRYSLLSNSVLHTSQPGTPDYPPRHSLSYGLIFHIIRPSMLYSKIQYPLSYKVVGEGACGGGYDIWGYYRDIMLLYGRLYV